MQSPFKPRVLLNQMSVKPSTKSPLDLVSLTPLMARTRGRDEIVIGLIDGPVSNITELSNGPRIAVGSEAVCSTTSSLACGHGTFVAAILAAERGSVAPAICPGCTLLVRPIFSEATAIDEIPSASDKELAAAIIDCVDRGARLLNLSVSLVHATSAGARELCDALDHAACHGVIVVAAAGNQGTVGGTALTCHPWVIPVSACDQAGLPMATTNLGRSIKQHGLSGPGERVTSLDGEGRPRVSGGTSIAAAFVTGALALAWSEAPEATATQVKLAVTLVHGSRRSGMAPPLIDAWGTHLRIQQSLAQTGTVRSMAQLDEKTQETTSMSGDAEAKPSRAGATGAAVVSQGAGCSCGGGEAGSPVYVYAIGRIQTRFPTRSIEKEFMQVAGRDSTSGLTDWQVIHAVLSKRENRYLARKICWVLSIEGLETYLVHPRDPTDLDLLIETLRVGPRPTDVDVVIGTRGQIASPAICNGLQVPMLGFDQIYSFDVDSLVKSIPRPEKIPDESFATAAEELFFRIMQLADNAGATDEHRAINYLAVRYPAIYAAAANAFARNEALASVEVRPSRLSGVRKVVDVVFSFVNRTTDVIDRCFVRVDVTEEFPFLVTKISPFYER